MILGNKNSNLYEKKILEIVQNFLTACLFLCISLYFIIKFDSIIDIFNHILMLVFIFICIYKGNKEKYFFNPYYLFVLTPISLLIYDYSISDYYFLELSQKLWNLAIISIGMFIFGLCSTESRYFKKNIVKSISQSQLRNHSLIFLFLGLMPTIVGLTFSFVETHSFNLITIKPYLVLMPLASVFSLFKFPAIVFAIKSRNRSLILFEYVVLGINAAINFNKTEILFIFIVIIIAIEKYKENSYLQKIKKYIFMGIVGIILLWSFAFYESIRGDFNTVDYILLNNRMNWTISSSLILPYLYFTTPWSNLQYVIETQSTHTYGLWTIKPLLGYLQLDGFFEKMYTLKSYTNFNTYTFITVQFKDFGIIGSGILSLLLGWVIKRIYLFYKNFESPIYTTIFSVFSLAILEMFFSNHFFMLSYPFTIILIMMLYNKFFLKKYVNPYKKNDKEFKND